jgi:hypothetical protein
VSAGAPVLNQLTSPGADVGQRLSRPCGLPVVCCDLFRRTRLFRNRHTNTARAHTHTRASTHTRTRHASTHAQDMHVRARACTHTRTHTGALSHTHTHRHTRTLTRAQAHDLHTQRCRMPSRDAAVRAFRKLAKLELKLHHMHESRSGLVNEQTEILPPPCFVPPSRPA